MDSLEIVSNEIVPDLSFQLPYRGTGSGVEEPQGRLQSGDTIPEVEYGKNLKKPRILDEYIMDTSQQAYSEAVETHTIAETSLSVTSLGEKD